MPSTWLSEVSPAMTPSRPGEYSRSSAVGPPGVASVGESVMARW